MRVRFSSDRIQHSFHQIKIWSRLEIKIMEQPSNAAANNSSLPFPTLVEDEGGYHRTFTTAVLMLTLIVMAINISHYLHKIKFTYLGESAVYLLMGTHSESQPPVPI